jgi:outer membrane protein OmpA-like peptidoglycan-associated protein/tetratricopeptide (TPR) repeat protein
MKKSLVFCFLFIALSVCSFSQEYNIQKIDKKAVAFYEQAMERARDGSLANAAGLLIKAIDTDKNFVDAYLSLAGVYSQIKNYKSSIENYEKAFALDKDYTIEYKIPYSIALAGTGHFEKALEAINELLAKNPPKTSATYKSAEYRKRTYEFAIDYAKNNAGKTYEFTPQNAGRNINSGDSEYFPTLSLDGKELVFTRRVKGMNEDFFISKTKSGEWEPARPLAGNLNTELDEAAQNISQDGQWMVYAAKNRPDGFGGYDLYISYLTPEGWSDGVNLGPKINSDQWESQPCFSPDKRQLYFSSRRFGGYGGNDIYVSRLQPNGRWSDPENLGPEINTPGSEACPFMHADNLTLYFTSNGHPGYGENDLFYVRKGPGDTWSKPMNLGYPINTINEEGTLFIAADGKTAYYASDRSDSYGGLDIYYFELREDVRPYRTLWVKGVVFDKKTSKGLPSSIELTELSTKQLISSVQTDEKGNYLLTLPVGKDYAFNINRKGYLLYSDNFLMSKNSGDSTYEKNIGLQPIEANATVVLRNIFFDVNKYDLKKESLAELDQVVQLLNENPGLKIEIGGHTDNTGKPADNLILSNNRAKAVVAYLVENKISPSRLVAKGYGANKPIASNQNEEGKAQNRRTELRIISK